MDQQGFEVIVRETISRLPEHIRNELNDVIILIEDRPPANRPVAGLLLGLYEGVPLTAWGRDFSGKLPDKITLFRETILKLARSEEELRSIIRETLLHEIAHHYGFGHDQIAPMERKWRSNRSS